MAALLHAQNAVDFLDKDLNDVKEHHTEAVTQNFADFLNQLATAMNSPEAAVTLYQTSGGTMPPAASVQTKYDHETPHEKADRDARDAARLVNLSLVAQMHCGLMRFGAVFITTPNQKGLQDDWLAWIKSATQIYLSVKDDGVKEVKILREKSVRDSPISSNLGFHGWGDKEQGQWSVKDIPKLYRVNVLDPLRVTPSTETLAAWDVYIKLKQADESDPDKWAQVGYPSLAFDRGSDDYKISHSTEKLQFLVELIKAHPSHPKLDEMIAETHDLLQDYRTRQAATSPVAQTPATTPDGASTNVAPSVTVTTDGDMTVVTTHTNAPPANPTP